MSARKPTGEEIEAAKELLLQAGVLTRCESCRCLMEEKSARTTPEGRVCGECHEWCLNVHQHGSEGESKPPGGGGGQ